MSVHGPDFSPAPDLMKQCLELCKGWKELWYIQHASLKAVWADVAVLGYKSLHPMEIIRVPAYARGPLASYLHSLMDRDLGGIPEFLLMCDRQRWEALCKDTPELVAPTIHETLSRIACKEDRETGVPQLTKEGLPCLFYRRETDAAQGELTAKRFGLWHPGTHRVVAAAASAEEEP